MDDLGGRRSSSSTGCRSPAAVCLSRRQWSEAEAEGGGSAAGVGGLERAGQVRAGVIKELREPRAEPEAVARAPELAPAARQPFFLHLRCRRA